MNLVKFLSCLEVGEKVSGQKHFITDIMILLNCNFDCVTELKFVIYPYFISLKNKKCTLHKLKIYSFVLGK